MSNPRPKSSQSDTSEKKKESQFDVQTNKNLKKLSQLVPPKIKIPKQDKGSFLSNDSSKNGDDTVSIGSRRATSKSQSQAQDVKTPRTSTLRTSSMVGYNGNQKRVLENQFNTKKLRFISLKREIEDKKRSSESAYEELFKLREKILSTGGKDPGKLEDLLPTSEIQPRPKADGDSMQNIANDDFLMQFHTILKQISDSAISFTQEILEKLLKLVNWMIEVDYKIDEYPDGRLKEEFTHQLELYKTETSELQERNISMQKDQQYQMNELIQMINCFYQDMRLLKPKQELNRLDEGASINDEDIVPAARENSNALEEFSKELRHEKEKLLKARSKIREQKTLISQMELKMQSEIEKSKHLDAQLKLKETSIMQKAKELNKHHKSNDVALSKLEKQKETVEARLAKLREELEFKDNETKNMVNDYSNQIEETRKQLDNEKKAKEEIAAQLNEFIHKHTKLEEKCKQLLEMHESKRKEALSDGNYTENEVQLFNELKETQRLLAEKEELIQRLQIEREDIITAVNEADQENDSSNQKLTGELLKKSNELHTVKNQFAQLQKNYKRMQLKSEQLEHKLEDMSRIQAQMKDGSRAAYGTQIMQLQTQVSDLRANLTETKSHNSELERNMTQLQVKLEHYKRYIRDLGHDLKVRKEMYQMLGNKEVDDMIDPKKLTQINEEFEKLYGIVEVKEGQVKKLEKIISQMEKQEEYSQAQRTRLEQRIGKLETALKEGQQAHRYVNRPQEHSINYGIETYHPGHDHIVPVSRTHHEVTRCNACPDNVKARVAAYCSSGCSSELVRRNASIERFYKRSDYTRRKQTSKRASAGLPVYKWFIKPFFRESSNHVVYNRHLKNLGFVAAATRERTGQHRHHERKVCVTNLKETALSYDDPTQFYN